MEVVGPKGDFNYLARGEYAISGAKTKAANFGFVCGGSGITPAFQVRPCLHTLDYRGVFNYLGRGEYAVAGEKTTAANFGFVCGGSGITPAFQVLPCLQGCLAHKKPSLH